MPTCTACSTRAKSRKRCCAWWSRRWSRSRSRCVPRPPASSPNRNSWSGTSRHCSTRSRSGRPRPSLPCRRGVRIWLVPPSPRSWPRSSVVSNWSRTRPEWPRCWPSWPPTANGWRPSWPRPARSRICWPCASKLPTVACGPAPRSTTSGCTSWWPVSTVFRGGSISWKPSLKRRPWARILRLRPSSASWSSMTR